MVTLIGYKFCNLKILQSANAQTVWKSAKHSLGTLAAAVVGTVPLIGYSFCNFKSLQSADAQTVWKSARHFQGTQAGVVVAIIGYRFFNRKILQMLCSVLKSAKHSQGTLAAAVVGMVPLIGYKFCNFKSLQSADARQFEKVQNIFRAHRQVQWWL